MKPRSGLLFILLILVQSGCGPTTYTISGTVTFDGEPVSEGHIAFIPDEGGQGGGGPIKAGHYSISVPPGKAKVQITATKMQPLPPGKTNMYGKTEEPRQFIPAEYNTKTELTADVVASTSLDFPLKSK